MKWTGEPSATPSLTEGWAATHKRWETGLSTITLLHLLVSARTHPYKLRRGVGFKEDVQFEQTKWRAFHGV